MRRIFRGRYVVPAALSAGVGVVGLLAFAPASASAQGLAAPTSTSTTVAGSPSGSTSATRSTPSSGTSGITDANLPDSYIAPGQALFSANCASCHGAQATGTSRAPNLQGLGAGTVDFWVSTGRMPLADATVQATRKPPRFDRLQTLEIAAYVQSLTPGVGTPVPVVNLNGADLEAGNSLFTLNCAACHTITGAGDALAGGAYAPSLHLATTTQIIEAIRSGPGNMPRFAEGNITNAEARDIAAYVHGVIQHPVNRGGFGLGGIGPVGEGFVGLLIGVGALMLVGFWIGERT